MLALAATIQLLVAAAVGPAEALAQALAVPGARAELVEVRATSGRGCTAASWSALRPLRASQQLPLRFQGRTAAGAPCQGHAWARARVLAPALVVLRDLRAGDPLAQAVAPAEQELLPGRALLSRLPDGAVADRTLRAGAALRAADVRTGPAPGDPVTVVVLAGDLQVEVPGRAVPCPRGRACALLPSGKRVEGRLAGGRVLLEAP
jgi:hypothetical protein